MKDDIIGKTFGDNTVVRRIENSGNNKRWLVRCNICGREKKFTKYKLLHNQTCICHAKNTNTFERKDNYTIIRTRKNEVILVDTEDLDLLSKYTWHVTNMGYASAYSRYTGKDVLMHRMLMGFPEDKVVDHINHNTLDNRKVNLRVCTDQENKCNNRAVGVIRLPNGRYKAYIRYNNKLRHLGCFSSYEEAKQCRIEAEKKYFREYRNGGL